MTIACNLIRFGIDTKDLLSYRINRFAADETIVLTGAEKPTDVALSTNGFFRLGI